MSENPEENPDNWQNIQFDSQILSSFMECPWKMNKKFNEHLVPVSGPSPSILKGSLAHVGLKTYYQAYKDGKDYRDRVGEALVSMRAEAPKLELSAEDSLLVYRTFEEYSEYRKNDIFQIVGVEQFFRILVYEKYPLRIYVNGRIDLILQDFQSGALAPWDHKSESERWFYSALSNQFRIYAIACKTNKLIVNRFGFQTSLKPEQKFKRDTIVFEPEVLEEFRTETLPYYALQMLICQEDGVYPRNFSSCVKGHFKCVFSDAYDGGICNVRPDIREEKLKRYFKVSEWDPNLEM